MDDLHLERLVERIERAFPGDLDSQRRAWEFIESLMTAWEEAAAPTSAHVAAEEPDVTRSAAAGRRLLEACRSMLRDTGGRLASAVQVLLPPKPGVRTLSRSEASQTIALDPEVAEAVGAERSVAVEYGVDYLTLIVRLGESAIPGRLGAIMHSTDEEMTVRRFDSVEPTVATAHFEFSATTGPIGVVVVLFDDVP